MLPCFHLSIGVRSIEESVEFFTSMLDATVTHRDVSGYVNLDLYGTQITLKKSERSPDLAEFHFGVNLEMRAFEAIAVRLLASGHADSIRVVDANTPMERKKLYVRCPSGYLIELKGYQ
jgi:extradiol dioxygenase family protein